MPSGGKKQTIGYKYHLGMHMVLCHGPIDHICNIKVDRRLAWDDGSDGGREEFGARAAELFGGDKREGGIGGQFDVEMGGDAQTENAYLVDKLGADIPAFRGVAAVVLNQCYVGNNPYLKPWSFCAQRIHTRQNGLTQWYDEKAAIGDAGELYAYHIMEEWTDPVTGGGTGSWERADTSPGSTAGASLGSNWFGTSPFPDTFGPGSIPINETAVYSGSITIPPLPYAAYIAVTIYHDDSVVDGSWDVTGASAYNFHSIDYFTSRYDIKIPENITATTMSFSYEVIQGYPTGTTTSFGGGYSIALLTPDLYYVDNPGEAGLSSCADMNPAHIIRECLTDPDWGMGYSDSDIDDTAFIAAADTLWDEALGMSLLWDRQTILEDFIAEVLRHIDAVLYVDRETGKFVLKLIRDDYALTAILSIDESNIVSVANARRPAIGELTNSVTVTYTEKSNDSGQGSASVQDQALIQVQGVTIGTNIQYPGFTQYTNAVRVAHRDLKALSIPMLSADIVVNRDASTLNVGDPFLFNWPKLFINNVVMRVQSISFGDNRDNVIKISAVEDVFSLGNIADNVIGVPPSLWIDPVAGVPEAALPRLITEAPYYIMAVQRGQLALDTLLADESDAGFLAVAAGRQGGELNANLLVDSGAGYVDSDVLDFAPYATLAFSVLQKDTDLYYSNGIDITEVTTGSIAQIGDELIRVDSFGTDSNGTYVTVGRGILDTTPTEHTAATIIIFSGDYLSSDEIQYTASDAIDVKIRTVLGSQILALADTPVNSITMDSRAIRPYPPGDLRIDGFSYPEDRYVDATADLSWVHRHRTQQTSGAIIDHFDGTIGPEASTTYVVESDAITAGGIVTADWLSEDVGNVTTWQMGSNFDGIPAGTRDLVFRVYAKRSGYLSWQPATVRVHLESSSNMPPSYAVSLLHFNGTNGQTTTTDEVSGVTWTLVGGAALDTSFKKFGTASCLFLGGDYCQSTDVTAFGSGDFAISGWGAGGSSAAIKYLWDFRSTSGSATAGMLWINGSDGKLRFYTNGADQIVGTSNVTNGSFYHWMLSRVSGTTRLFVNGTQEGSSYTDSANYALGTNGFIYGGSALSLGTLSLAGYLDECQIEIGTGEAANFTPPTSEHTYP